jgi:hypothetical protein
MALSGNLHQVPIRIGWPVTEVANAAQFAASWNRIRREKAK